MRLLKAVYFFLALLFLCPGASASPARPGETPPPRPSSFEVRMQAGFVFPSPDHPARADLENPADSGFQISHTLTVTARELRRVAGVQLPECADDEEIVLFEGGVMEPGAAIDTIRLSPLPDGRSLPEGRYEASMLIRLFDGQTGEEMMSHYRVECFVQVMTARESAAVDAQGNIQMRLHNATDAPARFALLISAEALGSAHGIDESEFGAQNSFAMLAKSDVVDGYESAGQPLALAALPDGSTISEGIYDAYLLRLPVDADQPPCAVARVTLNVPQGARAALPAYAIAQEDKLPLAQAVVDCAYLLSRETT